MIIFRYLARELLTIFLVVSSILLSIFIVVQFILFFNQAAMGKLAINLLLILLAIEVENILPILFPLSLFLSVLLVYSRLYADNEMLVLNACGFSQAKLLYFTLPVIASITAITLCLTLWVIPKSVIYRNALLQESGSAIVIQTAMSNHFQELENGSSVAYVESITPDHKHMKNLFIARTPTKGTSQPDETDWTILTSHHAYQTVNPQTKESFLVAVQGQYYKGIPGQKNFQIGHFDTYRLHIVKQTKTITENSVESMPTAALWQVRKQAAASSELHWRFAMPLATILLSLLAIPLSHFNPRQGKYTQLLAAILIYAFYLNFLIIGRTWIVEDKIPCHSGLWFVHLALLAVVIFFWFRSMKWAIIRKIWVR